MHKTLLTLTGLVIGFAHLSPTVAAPVPKEKKKTVEEKIVGTWKLVKTDNGPASGYAFTITFKAGGEMSFTRSYPGNDIPPRVSPGKFKAGEPDEKYKLGSIDWKVKEGNAERGEVSKILKLTDTEMEFEDPEGLKESFERVKEEKKDK